LQRDEGSLYSSFLETGCDIKLDFCVLSEGAGQDRALYERFYGGPDEPPRFFSHTSADDLLRLGKSVLPPGHVISMYQRMAGGELVKIADDTLTHRLLYPAKDAPKTHMFILQDKNTVLPVERAFFPPSHCSFGDGEATHSSDSLGEILSSLLDLPVVPELRDASLATLLARGDHLLREHPRPVQLVAHTGSSVHWSRRVSAVRYYRFLHLGEFNAAAAVQPTVIAFSLDESGKVRGSLVRDDLVSTVLDACLVPVQRATGVHKFMRGALEEPAEGQKAGKAANCSKRRVSAAASKVQLEQARFEDWWKEYPCRCHCCVEGRDLYSKNVSCDGPQPRQGCALDIDEFLLLFNLDSPEIREACHKVRNLSIAAFDLETYASDVCTAAAGGGRKRKVSDVTASGMRAEPLAVQRLALVGYGDSFEADEAEVEQHTALFKTSAASPPPQGLTLSQCMMFEFIEHVLERQKTLAALKRELLAPLFDFVSRWRAAHNEYWLGLPGADADECKESFEQSLAGKFERHLNRLAEKLHVFSFNGSRFDLVLLQRYLAQYFKVYFKSRSNSLRILKKGSKVNSISVPGRHVVFLDIMALLGPGSSLDQFAALTGQSQSKLKFPFRAFTSLDFLQSTALPSDPDMWYDDLRQKEVDAEYIRNAQETFSALNCRTVEDYLCRYLELDVVLLGRGVALFTKSFYDRFGVHPLDVGKYTLASYGVVLTQRWLYQRKRIAQFSPNVLPVYSALKCASTGGLCTVFRQAAVPPTAVDDLVRDEAPPFQNLLRGLVSPINGHIFPDNERLGKGLVVLDVNSLYPYSVS